MNVGLPLGAANNEDFWALGTDCNAYWLFCWYPHSLIHSHTHIHTHTHTDTYT